MKQEERELVGWMGRKTEYNERKDVRFNKSSVLNEKEIVEKKITKKSAFGLFCLQPLKLYDREEG